jgi:hypothetical protein
MNSNLKGKEVSVGVRGREEGRKGEGEEGKLNF